MVAWDGVVVGEGTVLIVMAAIVTAVILWVTLRPARATLPCGKPDTPRADAPAVRHCEAGDEDDGNGARVVRICSCSVKTCIEIDPADGSG